MKHSAITLLKKVLVYCAGLFIMAMGVSFSGTADLGMSPVNSIPYVLSEIFTFLSMGTWIIVIFSLYILIQFLILAGSAARPGAAADLHHPVRLFYRLHQLSGRPLSAGSSLAVPLPCRDLRGAVAVPGNQHGADCTGHPAVSGPLPDSLPGEGIMQVIADKLHLPLHTVKMCFDITVSLIALAISLAYFRQFQRHPGGHRDRGVRRGQDPGPVRAAKAPRAPVHVRAGSRVILYTAIPRRPGRLPGDFFQFRLCAEYGNTAPAAY